MAPGSRHTGIFSTGHDSQRARNCLPPFRGAILAVLSAVVATASISCGGGHCGLAQLRTVMGDGTTITTAQFFDIDLTARDIQQINVDSTPIPGQGGQVDIFVTSAGCGQLFGGSYTGTVVAPLCTIYAGPVAPGAVTPRQGIPAGKYRVVAQPWTTNVTAIRFGFDVVLWGESCTRSPTSPGAGS